MSDTGKFLNGCNYDASYICDRSAVASGQCGAFGAQPVPSEHFTARHRQKRAGTSPAERLISKALPWNAWSSISPFPTESDTALALSV
jgi:hypothetical protein